MKEIFALLAKFDIHGLLRAPTQNGLLQFFRYCFVGGIATVVDWGVLYFAEKVIGYYLIAAVAGFLCGLTCNYFMSKYLVFNGSAAKVSPQKEFLAYAAIGVAGLLLTLVLMYVLTKWMDWYFMLSKVVATALVLLWNFLARKHLLY